MRVLLVAARTDIAGQLTAIRTALAHERPHWRVDLFTCLRGVYGYPMGHKWDAAAIRRAWGMADVVHVCETFRAFDHINPGTPTPLVLHQHGTRYRAERRAIDEACRERGIKLVVSTVDLLGSPGVEWLPAVADLSRLRAIPRTVGDPPRIVQTPTNREGKGTELLLSAAQDAGFDVEIIEGVSWAESIARKAAADIVFDQLAYGYGLSAIEAWAMGIPVVSGAEPRTREAMIRTFDALPFVEATAESLQGVLRQLAGDPKLRRDWGELGATHAERYHSERAVVARLEAIYERAGEMRMAA